MRRRFSLSKAEVPSSIKKTFFSEIRHGQSETAGADRRKIVVELLDRSVKSLFQIADCAIQVQLLQQLHDFFFVSLFLKGNVI